MASHLSLPKAHILIKHTVLLGDAQASIQSLVSNLKEPYDLIFIDADKTSYPTYLSLILSLSPPTVISGSGSGLVRLLKPGAIIIADNILSMGLIADSSEANPWTKRMEGRHGSLWGEGMLFCSVVLELKLTMLGVGEIKSLDDFNKALTGDKRLETFLKPMFDGLGMARLVN